MVRYMARVSSAIAMTRAAMRGPWPLASSTNSIIATIAPGPPSSGVPSGTSATLTPSLAAISPSLPASSCRAMISSSSPPENCRAGSEMCM
ncbi:hypothetical protein D641_0104865 [Brachybacterium muris UCD-AY4]|uniref:Uncharacterized protein n=1 Tax=Brachybacterium muris UCD-AY4 TaxID=1249481 RepID=A0A022KUJ7_9MICO|nr:hypothetical protein D641_0104865 [Brachybacterium muris UCD-AY4]